MAEAAAALDINRPRGDAGRGVMMLHSAFTFAAAGDDSRSVETEQMLPALDALLGAALVPHITYDII